MHEATHLVNDVEFLPRFVKLERCVRTNEVDFIVKVYFDNVTISTRFESKIIAGQQFKNHSINKTKQVARSKQG